jgi:hypothetical protein
MRFEALAWSLLELIAPALMREARKRWTWATQGWIEVSAWARDLLVPYLALILGSISGRDAGLINLPLYSWVPAGTACLAGLMAAYLVLRSLPKAPQVHAAPLDVLRLEPRLALYRAAMATWLSNWPLAIATGGLLAAIEWVLTIQPWQRNAISARSWAQLARIAFSGVLFWATRNLWLTAATQTAVVLLVKSAQGARGSKDAKTLQAEGKESGSPARPNKEDESKQP